MGLGLPTDIPLTSNENAPAVKKKPHQAIVAASRESADKKHYEDCCKRAELRRRSQGKKPRSILKGPSIFTW